MLRYNSCPRWEHLLRGSGGLITLFWTFLLWQEGFLNLLWIDLQLLILELLSFGLHLHGLTHGPWVALNASVTHIFLEDRSRDDNRRLKKLGQAL